LVEQLKSTVNIGSTDELLEDILAGIMTVADGLRNFWVAGKEYIRDWMNYLIGVINMLVPFGHLKPVADSVNGYLDPISESYDRHKNEIHQQMELGRKLQKKQEDQDKALDAARKTEPITRMAADKHLEQINNHTRRAADILQLTYDKSQRVLGGGRVGSVGYTPWEIGSPRRADTVTRNVYLLVQSIYEMAASAAVQSATYGMKANVGSN
jgi:hypothetical protein